MILIKTTYTSFNTKLEESFVGGLKSANEFAKLQAKNDNILTVEVIHFNKKPRSIHSFDGGDIPLLVRT